VPYNLKLVHHLLLEVPNDLNEVRDDLPEVTCVLEMVPDEIFNLFPMHTMRPDIESLDPKADIDKMPNPPPQQ
jgi:hypothetical protein